MPEAPLEDAGSGLAPVDDGWFVVNVRDAAWLTTATFGSGTVFEGKKHKFPSAGFNVSVLMPGEPNCLYHREALQEDFLVLAGECKLLVDGEERVLHPWDFFHCTPGTDHVFVGSGDGPCVIVMTGVRVENEEDEGLLYPVSELAASYGASAEKETPDAQQAYARFERPSRGRPDYWHLLPWVRTDT